MGQEVAIYIAFLLAPKTASLLEMFASILLSKFSWFFFVVNVHGVGVTSRRGSGSGGGMKGYWGLRGMLLGDSSHEVLLAQELVYFFIPAFWGSGDYLHSVNLV